MKSQVKPRSGLCRMSVWHLPCNSAHRAEKSARAAVRRALLQAGIGEDDIFDADSAVAELAVNAVQHARPPYELRILSLGGQLPIWCEVVDSGPFGDVFGEYVPDEELSEHGRGLRLVDGLSAQRCAAYPTSALRTGAAAKAVGFALPCRGRCGR